MKFTKKERNFITLFLAIIAVIILVLLFLNFNKNVPLKTQSKRFNKNNEEDNVKQRRIIELNGCRDKIQEERYKLKQNLLKLRKVELWAEKQIVKTFNFFRWMLFGCILLIFILAKSSPDLIGFNVDDVLREISVVAILIVLLFFASSEKNDSLLKCYHRAKPFAVATFMNFTIKYLNWTSSVKLKEKELIAQEINIKYKSLIPIMNELKNLKQSS